LNAAAKAQHDMPALAAILSSVPSSDGARCNATSAFARRGSDKPHDQPTRHADFHRIIDDPAQQLDQHYSMDVAARRQPLDAQLL
jgi:hypothetical protein